jgi:hypothetical protein
VDDVGSGASGGDLDAPAHGRLRTAAAGCAPPTSR